MHGWTGRTVIIDLTNGKIIEKKNYLNELRSYIGGRGLGVKLYSDMILPYIDPLSPENILIFTTGPLTGTRAPLSGRHVMVSKSPLTGTIFDSSSGGFFGKELKFLDLDALIIKGAADEPVYISIQDENLQINNAIDIWGKNVRECTDQLSRKGSVACIGRAGERLVPIANVMNDYFHSCGRGGLGAVMGSKKLKAIVVKGTLKPAIADEDRFEKARSEAKGLIKRGSSGLSTYGTSALLNLMNYQKILPAGNFRKKEFSDASMVSGEFIKENYDIKGHACYNCAIACKHIIKSGAFEGYEVPEYETLWSFGPDNNNSDMGSIIKVNRLCNDYGIDTISAGSTIAAYAEIMGEDVKEFTELVKKMGDNVGVGKELGKGSKALSNSRGKDVSMQCKGLELPGYDPRGLMGMALAYATSNRGGCHLRAYMAGPEVLGKPKKVDRFTFSGKAELVKIHQDETCSIDSLVLCKFASFSVPKEIFAELLSAATGVDYSIEEFLQCGERIWNLERLFNNKAGFSRKDDILPERFFKTDGIDRNEFEKSLDEYYLQRGWDEFGVPTGGKLRELGIYKAF
ncbi:MAG: aldehyde ferredoxin oxidoreductase family protein [Candidatus Methanoperedens sp.]|nr:aldehyde ferredoxin oxidoreductase family protein [Candidatus Methanoperedens sp.]CAG0974194.1 aldehyde:ferredoxin oxidoreductase [Methanosarcinales archaeon]